VSRDNEFVDKLSIEELALVFSTAQTWSEINPDWPDEQIFRFTPGTDSGTFDYFVEAIFDKDKEPILNSDNIQFSEDDNVLVQGIIGSPLAIGYFGYAYYLENTDSLRIITIDDVEPTPENINGNLYPLARPLFIYSDAAIMRDNPHIAAYINFFLTYVNEEVEAVGYFALSQEALEVSMLAWLESMDY
ncbi:MAG: substrate-binding domain-containing protein, partial [Chloroflexota bacterium]